jgi:hypothetical protein
VPFIPQTGISESILQALQLANEEHSRRQQLSIQQQQTNIASQKAPAEIEELKARAGFYGAEAQKNQTQIDMMRETQKMFSQPQGAQGQPVQQQQQATQVSMTGSGATPGPNLQQQISMYPGSDLAKSEPPPTPAKWLPSNTPQQLAPFVNAMIPADLNEQEKNVIEGGAQTGRAKAGETGYISSYLHEIRSSVDSVITNRNKNVENQPLSQGDRDNFTKNILPSFENLSPAQVKGAAGELASVKDQKGLQQLEGRLMQQDNQALQRDIAQKNLVANKEIAHGQALDLSGRNKVVADTQKWGDTYTQAQMALKTIDQAKDGDDLATRMVPTMEVLGINMMGGIRRISPTEYEAARIPVSFANRFNQWVDSKLSGSTDPKMIGEGKRLMHDIVDVKYGSYLSEVNSTAKNFNLDPKSVYVMDSDGNSTTLSDALKSQPKGAKSVNLPEGAIRGTLNGKPGYALNGEFHPL